MHFLLLHIGLSRWHLRAFLLPAIAGVELYLVDLTTEDPNDVNQDHTPAAAGVWSCKAYTNATRQPHGGTNARTVRDEGESHSATHPLRRMCGSLRSSLRENPLNDNTLKAHENPETHCCQRPMTGATPGKTWYHAPAAADMQPLSAAPECLAPTPSTYATRGKARRHTPALVGFLPLRNPHPKNAPTRPRRNTGARAAMQDPNVQLSATNAPRPQIRRCNDETNTAPHTCFGGSFPLRIRETPAKLCADEAPGETRGHAQPRKIPTLKYCATHLLQRVFSPSVKPDPKNALTTPAEIRECTAAQDPDRRVSASHGVPHTRLSGCGNIRMPPRLGQNTGACAAMRDPNTRPSATNAAPPTCFGRTSTTQYLTQQMHNDETSTVPRDGLGSLSVGGLSPYDFFSVFKLYYNGDKK
ncbi:hypothetical protein BS47DRAFT_1357311 [Hydnum rufescens UP504]|uniref:Uncharacterized protein n=1 Tax=Hydnum rufescens UP504 TaxID=1448309 RepID=A0A9P6BA74_9AGAM|nr:hypothetical protein BS47DRAFT_1357311 [Hydnum rufescens UP504]